MVGKAAGAAARHSGLFRLYINGAVCSRYGVDFPDGVFDRQAIVHGAITLKSGGQLLRVRLLPLLLLLSDECVQ